LLTLAHKRMVALARCKTALCTLECAFADTHLKEVLLRRNLFNSSTPILLRYLQAEQQMLLENLAA
jgi:hypothetical protein